MAHIFLDFLNAQDILQCVRDKTVVGAAKILFECTYAFEKITVSK